MAAGEGCNSMAAISCIPDLRKAHGDGEQNASHQHHLRGVDELLFGKEIGKA